MPVLCDRSTLLGKVPLFDGLSRSELAAVLEHSVERRYGPGQNLFCEGDACAGLFVLLVGRVKICKTSASGREIALHMESAPGTLAEVPLFDGGPYPATARAIDEVVAVMIDRGSFERLCKLHSELPCRVLAAVGRRLRAMVGLIERLTFGGVRQQLAQLLLDLREEVGDDTFPLPVTLQEIALRLGTVREVVSRNLSRFQAHGLIRVHKREVVILDAPGLAREAETEL